MKTLGISALVLGAMVLTGCEDPAKRILFDGQRFRTKVSKVDRQLDFFSVTVGNVSRSEQGARQAAYHEGVSYCVRNFGSSDILWSQNPLDEEQPLQVTNDTISFQGRCPQAQKI